MTIDVNYSLQIGPASFPLETHSRSPAFETRLLRRNSAVVGGPGTTRGTALFTLIDPQFCSAYQNITANLI